MDSLPDEILINIFSYLNIYDLALAVQYVCRRWAEVSLDDELWKGKFYEPSDDSEPEIVLNLMKMPKLRSFKSQRRHTELVISTLSNSCRNLTELNIGYFDISLQPNLSYSMFYNFVHKCPHIEVLEIEATFILTEQYTKLIATWQKLKKLDFVGMEHRPLYLRHLADGCPSLEHLGLHSGYYKNKDFEYLLLKKRTQLTSVVVNWCVEECKSTVPLLKLSSDYLEALSILYFMEVMVTESFETIKALKGLKILSLIGLVHVDVNLIIQVFQERTLSHLVMLDLSYYEELDDTLAQVICQTCPLLEHLSLQGSLNLSGQGLKYIGLCPQMMSLDLFFCDKLTDDGIAFIVQCRKLRKLNLTGCSLLTSVSMGMLVYLQQLRSLIACYCNTEGLPIVLIPTHLPYLQQLDLSYCLNLDREALYILQENMPHLLVLCE